MPSPADSGAGCRSPPHPLPQAAPGVGHRALGRAQGFVPVHSSIRKLLSCAALASFLSEILPGKKQLLITKVFQRWTGLQK